MQAENWNRSELIELLTMPYDRFCAQIMPRAKEVYRQARGDELVASAMLGYSNVCKNNCLYCGMRAKSDVKRYRIGADDVIQSAKTAKGMGFSRLFLISGEDLGYGYENLLQIIRSVKELGLTLSLACGEFSPEQYAEFATLGVDEYVLKFEMSDRETFNRLNPSTDFDRRMKSIEAVQNSGMRLASGNIVDFPGQTIGQLAEGGRGDITLNLREISILRLMMPSIDITAQQPGHDPTRGLADDEGNLLALGAGANKLFADLLPDALVKNFSVIDNRITLGREHIQKMADAAGMKLV